MSRCCNILSPQKYLPSGQASTFSATTSYNRLSGQDLNLQSIYQMVSRFKPYGMVINQLHLRPRLPFRHRRDIKIWLCHSFLLLNADRLQQYLCRQKFLFHELAFETGSPFLRDSLLSSPSRCLYRIRSSDCHIINYIKLSMFKFALQTSYLY